MSAYSWRIGWRVRGERVVSWLAVFCGSVVIGAAVPEHFRMVAAGFMLVFAVGGAFSRPYATIVAVLTATSFYFGFYETYRVSVAGVPMSAFDAFPVLLLVAGLGMRRRGYAGDYQISRALRGVVALFAGGVVIGCAVGVLLRAPMYELLRVARNEIELLVGLAAVMLAGRQPEWRRAIKTGLVALAVLSAVEILVDVTWLLTTGHSFWEMFPFGTSPGNVASDLQAGDVNVLRTNFVPTEVMLPALAYALGRYTRRRAVLAGLILAATVVSLSRGYWGETAIVLLLVIAYRLSASRAPLQQVLRWLGIAIPIIAAVVWLVGGAVQQRTRQTTSLTDGSASYRKSESEIAMRDLTSDPITFVLGTGAGVVPPGIGTLRNTIGDTGGASFLEDSLLSRWTNLSLLSAMGAVILLLGPFRTVWASRFWDGRSSEEADLYTMGLALPAILIGGIVGGTLEAQGTIVAWVLAGTLLVVRVGTATRTNRSASRPLGALRP